MLLPAEHAIASLAFLLSLHGQGDALDSFTLWSHITDIGWPALLCLLADDPGRPFYALFFFAIIAAAFRWGFIETMATALVSVACLVLQAPAASYGPAFLRGAVDANLDGPRLVLRCVFLVMAGALLGWLAETEKELAEIELSNYLLSLARAGERFSVVLRDVLSEVGNVFGGTAVHEVILQRSTGRAFRWEIPSLSEPSVRLLEIAATSGPSGIMTGDPDTFFVCRKDNDGTYWVTALDSDGSVLDVSHAKPPEMPAATAKSVMVVSHEMGRDWYGRFIVLDARLGRQREAELRFAQHLLRQLAPALYSVYLVRSFRSRAGANERARVARELHDTTIQSLIGIEMQVDVLRRTTGDPSMTAELDRVQQLLRREVLNLRELMQSIRPIDIGPHQLVNCIEELVERFRRDTGIAVRFVPESQDVRLPASACRELVRVVQEALVNVRRHSRAASAVVGLDAHHGIFKVSISDDGQGFPFGGSYTLSQMESLRRGPAVIKERVRMMGGDMMLDSTPGHGSRLEITIPQKKKGYEAYG